MAVHHTGANNTELPPRARRILIANKTQLIDDGTTSACAENTNHGAVALEPWGNYLRVRGEYLPHPGALFTNRGTTSACAENTYR